MDPNEIIAIWRRVTRTGDGKSRSMILQEFADLVTDRAMARASKQLEKRTDAETILDVIRVTAFVQRSKDEEDLIQYLDRAFRSLAPSKFSGKLADSDFERVRSAVRHYYNVRYASFTTNLALEGDVLDAEQAIRVVVEKLVKPQKREVPDWLALTGSSIEDPPEWFFRPMWLAAKNGEVLCGQYESKNDGRHFRTIDRGLLPCNEITHTAPVSSPIHPGTALSS